MADSTNPQRVIVYGRGDALTVYSTAYTDDEVKRQVTQCVEKHGRHMGVRSMDAKDAWAEQEQMR